MGPLGALKRLTEAITEPVSVDGVSAPVRESVNIGLPDPAVRLRTPQTSLVVIDVAPAPLDRTIADVPIGARGDRASTAALKPPRVAVIVRGPRDVIDGLQPVELEASVDVEGRAAGDYQLPVRVVAPNRVTIIEVEPAQVQVRVR